MSRVPLPDAGLIALDVQRALTEDVGSGDVSADLIDRNEIARAVVIAREPGVLCGLPWAHLCLLTLDPNARIENHAEDGDLLAANGPILTITGRARALLSAERSLLNFVQTLSATASVTRRYVEALAGFHCRVLDTRKTLPGLRHAQKYAVRCGGGVNHRMGLYDQVLIKENHIVAAGSIAAAVAAARRLHPALKVEVETETLAEFEQALAAHADRIMLDEFSLADMHQAVALNRGRAELEVSGSVTLDTLKAFAATGVDYISVGALTKHVHALDLSMRIVQRGN